MNAVTAITADTIRVLSIICAVIKPLAFLSWRLIYRK